MKKLLTTIFGVIIINTLCAATFWGYVRDSQTGENLIGAYVYTSDNRHLKIGRASCMERVFLTV